MVTLHDAPDARFVPNRLRRNCAPHPPDRTRARSTRPHRGFSHQRALAHRTAAAHQKDARVDGIRIGSGRNVDDGWGFPGFVRLGRLSPRRFLGRRIFARDLARARLSGARIRRQPRGRTLPGVRNRRRPGRRRGMRCVGRRIMRILLVNVNLVGVYPRAECAEGRLRYEFGHMDQPTNDGAAGAWPQRLKEETSPHSAERRGPRDLVARSS